MTNSASSTKPTNVKKSQAGETQSQLPFFVYGTLRVGQGNWERLLKGKTTKEIPAFMPNHKMYSRGIAYVTDDIDDTTITQGQGCSHPQSGGRVIGDLMYVKPEIYQDVQHRLDQLEGYNPLTDMGHYRRVKRLAEYTDSITGQVCQVEAWVYHGGSAVLSYLQEEHRVLDGDWLRLNSSSKV